MKYKIDYDQLRIVIKQMLSRINTVPFLETTEEIRLGIVNLMELIL